MSAPAASRVIGTLNADAPYATLQRAMHIHPTVGELAPTYSSGPRR